ncbi:MAG: hypothetical protein IT168_05765 [Bryobacterales bacterium]|nr:hypothetical protein [Bryobacterales bacterium]
MKTLQQLAAEAVAKSQDYDPVKINALQNATAIAKELARTAAAKHNIKEPDLVKMKGLVNELQTVVEERRKKWELRYSEWSSLKSGLKGRQLTQEERKSLDEARKKCESSLQKYNALYQSCVDLSKTVKPMEQLTKGFQITMLLNYVNQLRAKIGDVRNLLMSF